MTIKVNGKALSFREGTLAELLLSEGFMDKAVATAVDGAFVPRDRRDTFRLSDGMVVEVLSPMQGG